MIEYYNAFCIRSLNLLFVTAIGYGSTSAETYYGCPECGSWDIEEREEEE